MQKILTIMVLLCLPTIVMAEQAFDSSTEIAWFWGDDGELSVQTKQGSFSECRKGQNRLSGKNGSIKFCHNCRKSGGDRVVWTFLVLCNGKSNGWSVIGERQCKKSIPSEKEQREEITELAQERMEENIELFPECKSN